MEEPPCIQLGAVGGRELPTPPDAGLAAPCPQPHLVRYGVLPMQKLMMLGNYEEKHKEMDSFPIRKNV